VLRWLKNKKAPQGELDKILDGFKLDSFPEIVTQALRMLRDPKCTLSAVAEQVEKDPAVTAKLLGLTNSAARGLSRVIRNVDHALALLGRSEVESMLLGFAVGRAVSGKLDRRFDRGRYWKAAARRAVTARRLAAKLHPATAGETFTASLLQDMAVPVLAQAKGELYYALFEQWQNDGGDLSLLEQGEFKWDHAYVGATMAERWNFPATLIEAIGGHHRREGPLAATQLVGCIDNADEPNVDELIQVVEQDHGLASDDVRELIAKAFVEADEIGRLFTGL
jgi:HD-like signal output (HDOD) protein